MATLFCSAGRPCLAVLACLWVAGLALADNGSDEQCAVPEVDEKSASLLQSARRALAIPTVAVTPAPAAVKKALHPAAASAATVASPQPAAATSAAAAAFSYPILLPQSNCYKDPWMDEMVQVDPDGDGKVFVDVGCNTGSDAVMWLERWGRSEGVARRWDEGLLKNSVSGGACGQNVFHGVSSHHFVAINKSNASQQGPKVLCVEPVPRTAKMLLDLTTNLFGTDTSFEVVHAAVSDQVTNHTVLFPDAAVGVENRGFNNLNDVGKPMAQVPVRQVTVDQLIMQHGFKSVDVLTIDTEGHDPLVIQGAENALRNGTVRFLVFEVHQDLVNTAWAKTPLISMLQKFEGWKYDCYLTDNLGKLHRLSGVWNAEMENRYHPIGWSNVACVKKGDKWHAILEKYNVGF